jgi:hypothetical protein
MKIKPGDTAECAFCGEEIVVATDGSWVHPDPDEDPTSEDYGWVKCSGQDDNESGRYWTAAPLAGTIVHKKGN